MDWRLAAAAIAALAVEWDDNLAFMQLNPRRWQVAARAIAWDVERRPVAWAVEARPMGWGINARPRRWIVSERPTGWDPIKH